MSDDTQATPLLDAAGVQAIVDRGPYLSWLGLEVLSVELEALEARARWRPEWVANPKLGQTHGGILAALIDFAADFALVGRLGGPVPTIDLRVDYHRLATQGDLWVRGEVIKQGRQFAVSEARIYDAERRLIASGRGAFVTAVRTTPAG